MARKRMYIAVVMTAGQTTSKRDDGDYSAFVGTDKNETVGRAMKAKAKWEASGRYGPYTVFAGPLTQVAKEVRQFTLKAV